MPYSTIDNFETEIDWTGIGLAGAMQLGSGARASRPQFSASRRKPRTSNQHTIWRALRRFEPVGGTPTGATGTVALPVFNRIVPA